ncbi:MAG TPA: glycosyltransferase, partial [Verrucomicrobiae bacterium]|nr:glycosyltransferase [Verrucomicrobiae bacterium]
KLLPQMLDNLAGLSFRIFVVDDGCEDNTAEVAARFFEQGVRVVKHGQNRGLGEALRTGFNCALQESSDNDVIITLDSDNTHPSDLIPSMVKKIDTGLDIVVASRFAPGGGEVGLSLRRRFLSRGAGWLMSLFFPLEGIKDYSCGFRAYRASCLAQGIDFFGPGLIESAGFAVSVEILLKLTMFGPACGEVPLVLRYDQKQGKSKLPLLRTILGYVQLIFRLKRKPAQQAEVEV